MEETLKITAGELPLEGPSDGLIVVLEAEDALGHRVVRSEVGRDERFALEDREVDLDLIEPACMLGQVDEGEVVEAAFERSNLHFDRIDSPFKVGGVQVDPGDYDFYDYGFSFNSNPSRRLFYQVRFQPATSFTTRSAGTLERIRR